MTKKYNVISVLTLGVALAAFAVSPVFAGGGDAPAPTQMMEPAPPMPEPTPEPMAMPVMNGQGLSDLTNAVRNGVNTHPRYGIVANSRRATDEELRQAKALYLPSIDARADYGWEYTKDQGTKSASNADEDFMRYDTSLTLTQMLFDGFRTKYENARQTARVESASHRVRETSEFLGLDVVESYLDVIRQRQLLGISRENINQHVEISRQIQDGASAGRSTQADVEQSNARLAAARAQEASVLQSLRDAESNYLRNVGEAPGDLQMPGLPGNALSANVDEEVRQSLASSPTLEIYDADIDVAVAEKEGTSSTMYPEVDFQLNGRNGENLGGVEGRDRSASALVVANWNLFRGGADMARTREFIYRHAQAQEEKSNVTRAIENDVRQTWAQMVASGERSRQFEAQATANEQVVSAYMDQFELDRRTLLDVLDAQNEWFVSRSNMINNQILQMFAVYRLVALKGQLLPSLNVAYPVEADANSVAGKKSGS
ncbi:MAG: TolC family outer membrane protein [Pseudomonadota bacterium]